MFKTIGRSSNWIRRTSTNTSPSAGPSTQRSLSSVPLPLNNTTLSHNHCLQQGVINCAPSQLKHTFYRNMSSEEASSQPLKQLNRLAQEKSPYLLQHATNPVDWYPWGDEAIERARRENKIIFVSVGYSTCHWCHVMEAESFNNANVAKLMNDNFINVKIDREERPDIDKIYMQFVLMMNGTAGWPMSVWLTPDLAPITAGTYFPPVDRYGMASFTTVLKVIATKWQSDQEELRETGHNVVTAIQQSLSEKNCTCVYEPGSADAKLRAAMTIFKQRFDQQFGGFGTHPKFPEVPRLNFLFHAYVATKDSDVLDMALQTLRKVGNGGIHDHVFGGFSRYSVDRQWHVPHFEKMLYDQGQLMAAYATAYKMTREEDFLRIGDRIFRYIMKDLRHPDGGFYSGEDADSLPVGETRKIEGAFYTWTASEIQGEIAEKVALYPDEFDAERVFKIYSYHYDVRPVGNVEPSNDPYGHFGGKNILIVRHSEEDTRTKYGLTEEQLKQILRITNDALLKRREQRPRPPLDTKIITSWNGLLLSGLSKLANCGSEKREEYMEAARKLLDFIRGNLYDSERRRLWRSCYGVGTDNSALESNSVRIDGFLDDYAFLIKGLHDYYKASLDADALHWSKELQDVQDQLFWDEQRGAYYFSQTDAPNVVMRLKPDHDSAEPSGNSVAARNLILLSYYFDDEGYRKRVAKLFNFFVDSKVFNPSLPEMACALLLNENGLDLVAVVGPDSEVTQRFVDICRKFYIPGMIILHVDPQNPTEMYKRLEEKFKMVQGKPTVYICHEKVCRMPVTDPAKLEQHLEEHYVFKNNI